MSRDTVPRHSLEAELSQIHKAKRRSNSHRAANDSRSGLKDITNVSSICPSSSTRGYDSDAVARLNLDFMKVLEVLQIGKARIYRLTQERSLPEVKQIFSELTEEIWNKVFSLKETESKCLAEQKRDLQDQKDACLKDFTVACKEQVAKLKAQVNQLKGQVVQFKDQASQLKAKCIGLTAENKKLAGTLSKTQQIAETLRTEGDVKTAKAELVRAEQVICQLRAELNNSISAQYIKEEENAELRCALKQRDKSSAVSRHKSYDRHANSPKVSLVELEELKSKLKNVEGERDQLIEWKANFSQVPEEYQRTLEELKRERQAEKAYLQMKIQRLREDVAAEHEQQILELKDTILHLQTEAEELQANYDDLRLIFNRQQEQFDDIKEAHAEERGLFGAEKSALSAKVAKLSGYCSESSQYLAEIDALKDAIEVEVDQLKLELTKDPDRENYEEQVELLREELTTLQHRLHDREKALGDASSRSKSLDDELKANRRRLSDAERELRVKSADVKSLEDRVKRKVAALDELKASSAGIEQRYEELLRSARDQAKALEIKLNFSETQGQESAQLRLQISNLMDKAKVDAYEATTRQAEHQRLAEKAGGLQAECLKLQEILAEKDAALLKLKAKLSQLKAEYQKAIGSSHEAHFHAKDQVGLIAEYRGKVERLQAELADSQQARSDLKAICAEKQELIIQLRDSIAEQTVGLQLAAKTEAALRRLEKQGRRGSSRSSPTELKKLEGEKQQLERKCEELGSKLLGLVSSMEANPTGRFEKISQSSEIEDLRSALSSARSLIDKQAAEIKAKLAVKSKAEGDESQKTNAMQELALLRKEHDDLQVQLKSLENQLTATMDKATALETTNNELRQALHQVETALDEKQTELDVSNVALSRIHETWSQQEAEVLDLKEQLSEQHMQIELLTQQLNGGSSGRPSKVQKFSFAEYLLANEGSSLELSKDDLKEQEEKLQLRLLNLLDRNEELQRENELLKSQRGLTERMEDSLLFSPDT